MLNKNMKKILLCFGQNTFISVVGKDYLKKKGKEKISCNLKSMEINMFYHRQVKKNQDF